eukprot:TRINITY_DN7616_c0_g1_i6.p1 TRINITY_DN7616_c0_g1~~TRINITY_DN7616_c0_g1_i6.p1  ORF type:complete len:1267 (+),score=235.13 TRINITY_DN7616_c0_g1_i6:61-3861(+)
MTAVAAVLAVVGSAGEQTLRVGVRVAAPPQPGPGFRAEVADVTLSAYPGSPPPRPLAGLPDAQREGRFAVYCLLQDGGPEHLVAVLRDPRWWHAAPPLDPTDRCGGRVRAAAGVLHVWVHPATAALVLRDASPGRESQAVRLPLPRVGWRRGSALVLAGGDIANATVQMAGPVDAQNNFVFLSGGYTKDQKAMFDEDVKSAVEFMKVPAKTGYAEYGKSVALTRYVSMFNVFSVFQPSVEEGATRPNPPAPQLPVSVNNNLGCRYGGIDGQPERMLTCDTAMVNALASTAPSGADGKHNVIVIAIVNSDVYGGAGMYLPKSDGSVWRHAAFFNGFLRGSGNFGATSGNSVGADTPRLKEWASLFFHEVGHALADLYDEYSFGASSREKDSSIPNCAMSASNPPWSGWLALQPSTDEYKSIEPTPVPVCGYTDYYKASDECIMAKLSASRLCPVCREASVLAMYAAGLDITYPRCPLKGEVVVLQPGQHAWLYFSRRLGVLGGFNVTWSVAGAEVSGSNSWGTSLRVAACPAAGCGSAAGSVAETLPEGTHTVSATVSDNTDWVLVPKRHAAMDANTTFTVRVLAGNSSLTGGSIPSATRRSCNASSGLFDLGADDDGYLSYCSGIAGEVCSVEYTAGSYQMIGDIGGLATTLEGSVFGTIGGCIAAILLIFLALWCYIAKSSSSRAKCVYEDDWPTYLRVIRWMMMGSAVIFMLSAVAATIAGFVLYSDLGAIGKLFAYAALIFTIIMFTMAFVGFTASYFVSKCALTANGVLLVIAAKAATAFAVFAIIFHHTVDDPESWAQKWLEDIWVRLAEDQDEMLCSLEAEMECSGYHESCQRVRSLSFCPENCDEVHLQSYAGDACEAKIKNAFEERWITIVIIGILLAIALWVGVVFNFLLRRSIGKYRKKMVERNLKRVASARKMSKARRKSSAGHERRPSRFTDRRTSAATQAAERGDQAAADLVASLRELPERQRELLEGQFARVDGDKDGKLERREFRKLIKAALLYSPTAEEVGAVYERFAEDPQRLTAAEFAAAVRPTAEDVEEIVNAQFGSSGAPGGPPLPLQVGSGIAQAGGPLWPHGAQPLPPESPGPVGGTEGAGYPRAPEDGGTRSDPYGGGQAAGVRSVVSFADFARATAALEPGDGGGASPAHGAPRRTPAAPGPAPEPTPVPIAHFLGALGSCELQAGAQDWATRSPTVQRELPAATRPGLPTSGSTSPRPPQLDFLPGTAPPPSRRTVVNVAQFLAGWGGSDPSAPRPSARHL